MSSNGRTADSGSVNGGSTPSIPAIVCCVLSLLARSSSGSGRRPLKAEITGSNPVRATKSYPRVFEPGVFFVCTYFPVATCPLVAALLGAYFEIVYGIQPFNEVECNLIIVNLRAAIGIRRLAEMHRRNYDAKGRAPCERGLGGGSDGESSDCHPKTFKRLGPDAVTGTSGIRRGRAWRRGGRDSTQRSGR